MRKQQETDTGPELAVRKALFKLGLRYRTHLPVPGRARRTIDIAFTRPKVAIFVDGCFWHSCPIHRTQPEHNSAWWRQKLEGNVLRDRDTDRMLEEQDWTVLRFWEHEETDAIVRVVTSALAAR